MPRKKATAAVEADAVQNSSVVQPTLVNNPSTEPIVSETVAPEPIPEVKTETAGEKTVEIKTEDEKSRVSMVINKPAATEPTVQNQSLSQYPQPQRPLMNNQQRPNQPVQNPNNRIVRPVEQVKLEQISGVLEIMQDNSGFVRPKFAPSPKDAFINQMQIRRYGLRAGDMISGVAKAPKDNEKYWAMVRLDKVNDGELAAAMRRPDFKDLVPVYPEKQVKLESDPQIMATRIIDLFSPIGFGQRGMIVSPPKAGKTTLLKEIAAGVTANYPNVHLMAVLVGERPEEVTDMQRFIKGEVIASHFDQKPEEQTRAAEIAIERAKRLVELGKDVFMVFDSITRLARAYNLAIPTSGRTLSGGFDPAALYPSKRFFGAARKIENGGSLTIIGTALVDTGSKMGDLVFEEFKGTGNM
ncbi:MAG TPA: transcription termination factor Rho, partial [Patescibacteria group bacterium]